MPEHTGAPEAVPARPASRPRPDARRPGPAAGPLVLGSPELAPPPRTLIDILLATAATHPDAPAIDDGSTTLTYGELVRRVEAGARALAARGVRRGDRIGVRLPSGSHRLYESILAVLTAGAAYVPVDADDPDERAELVFGEAGVRLVLEDTDRPARVSPGVPAEHPTLDDDAWVIFTSGSTGVPKGVAVGHRNAAAFVDAEAGLFLADAPLGPGDRVLAGLSVAFDASCEEMWLAWRHGACLVPAPRSLVRSGVDLGAWLVRQQITVVSTVPTLAALWPQESLDAVRLLIFGGEACPPELAERLVDEGREVWNTYGPTEATVVACAARLGEDGPVRIGLPLDGWTLAVVDSDEQPVPAGGTGQLIIGGAGLARYLDPVKDAAAYAPMPSLGWSRAYRSGDLVRFDPDGLLFVGRADDQVKVGGRRIELGEVDAALLRLPGVDAAATAVRRTPAGTSLLVGYVVTGEAFDRTAAGALLRESLPAALVPVLAQVETIPTRTSGKVDRDALPWPLPGLAAEASAHTLTGLAGWLADHWAAVLGTPVSGPDADFFAHGGGSLSAAQLVSRMRTRFPGVTVGEIYTFPTLGELAEVLGGRPEADPVPAQARPVRPVPRRAQAAQSVLTLLAATLTGLQALTVLAALDGALAWSGPHGWAPTVSWWWVLGGAVLLLSPFGRMAIAVTAARTLLHGVRSGEHPRGGSVHLRLWAAGRIADAVGAVNLAGAPWIAYYARALGAQVARDADLHSLPPVTGMLRLGSGCAIEPEVDLAGYWVDGDVVRVGAVEVGRDAVVRARSTLGPGARVGDGAEVEAGSFVEGAVPAGERWAGVPAARVGRAHQDWPPTPLGPRRRWLAVYGASSALLSLLPLLSAVPALLLAWTVLDPAGDAGEAAWRALAIAPAVTLVWFVVQAGAVAGLVRLLGAGTSAGFHPVRSRIGWQAWAIERLLDAARTQLFPLYSSLATPTWLRLLGARVGRDVEASTVLLQPRMTTVGDGAFLADDTMVASYELGGGWLRLREARIGKRGFLGNSGITAPGRSVPKNGLVAVLSAAPPKAKKGSSWLGSPPARLRRSPDAADVRRTFAPSRSLRAARALVELCRFVPTACTVALGLGYLLALATVARHAGWVVAGASSGALLLVAGVVAALVTVAAKWLLSGRTDAGSEHPLWSGYVWRNEVVDTFVEVLAAPWFARTVTGTPLLSLFLRGLGARIGRGVWCETYWLPEADLVRLGDAVTVNRGCVVQTHLFHDRIMRMDRVELNDGASLGPHGVILPAAELGDGASVGPASLVMRGEAVPAGTRWIGNPIAPWTDGPASAANGGRR